MKINISKHDIVDRSRNTLLNNNNIEFLGLKEMPLSYINTQDYKRNPKVVIDKKYLESSKKRVIPYSSFPSNDIYLFNNKNEIIEDITLKRIGSEYFFETIGQTEYNPLRYSVYLELKKNFKYTNNRNYNITISTMEDEDDLTLSSKLISIFGDKNIYGNCPSNIIVNNGDKEIHTFMSKPYLGSDFLFIRINDRNNLDKKLDEENLTIDEILDSHTNLWLICKDWENRFITETISDTSNLPVNQKDNVLYDSSTYNMPMSNITVFNQKIGFVDTTNTYTYEYLNEFTLVMHKRDKGYIIITPEWILDSLNYTDKIIYETIMNVFMKSYIRTKSLDMWITDEPIDYLAYHKKKYNRCHNIVTLNDFLINTGVNVTDDYSIRDVKISTEDVSFVGINNKNELMFFKTGGETNPPKKNNEVSYYTTKHSIINYSNDDIFMIETPLVIETTSTDSGVYLTIKPVYSTSKKLRVDEEQTFKITNFATQYNIFVDKGSKYISNNFYVVPRTEIPERGWTYVGVLSFDLSENITSSDTRIMGGGLPLDQPDDFDMLDIGHIYGRPYRLGNTIIIKLPKKVSNFDKRIKKELNKHIAAGDEYVIHYNNE